MSRRRELELDLSGLFEAHWTSESGFDRFFTKVLGSCVEWFSAAGVSLFLKREFDGRFHLAAQDGPLSQVPLGAVLTPGEGLASAAIEKGKAQLIQDGQNRATLSSAMLVPLSTPQSGCIGILNVSRSGDSPKFSTNDLKRADSIGRYVALAVHNARLVAGLNQAAAQSQALNAKLDAIISTLGVGVLVVNEFGQITGWNPEASRILGSSLEAGAMIEEVGDPAVLSEAILRVYASALDGDRSNTSVKSADGTAWSIIASPLATGGATLAIQDITDQERAQQEVARVRRLAEIGQMTAAIAHEIRNPLTGIRSAAQMVQESEGEAAEFGKIIEEEALKLNALCDEFLEFARPLQLTLRNVDAGKLMESLAQRHWQDFARAEIKLNLEIDDPSPKIEADPLRLEQVFRNLLLNALQACTPGDEVTVVVAQDRIEVRDNGAGIDEGMKERLFTPFFTTKPSGTGLGLPNVRKIVDAHGWTIGVDTEEGAGTTFVLVFGEERAA